MREIIISTQFKKDLKLARKRNLCEDELNEVVFQLASDMPLSSDKRDHQLSGNMSAYRECHIKPDWLLIYKKIDDTVQVLMLYRTGTHADLFK